MYDEQIEVFVGQANVSASIGVLVCFLINCFEYSDRAEYSVAEISAGTACVLIGNLMYLSRRENSKIWNLIKLKGCDAKK